MILLLSLLKSYRFAINFHSAFGTENSNNNSISTQLKCAAVDYFVVGHEQSSGKKEMLIAIRQSMTVAC